MSTAHRTFVFEGFELVVKIITTGTNGIVWGVSLEDLVPGYSKKIILNHGKEQVSLGSLHPCPDNKLAINFVPADAEPNISFDWDLDGQTVTLFKDLELSLESGFEIVVHVINGRVTWVVIRLSKEGELNG